METALFQMQYIIIIIIIIKRELIFQRKIWEKRSLVQFRPG